MMYTPFVSVIIPVFNDFVRLEACLAQLGRQSYPASQFEIILVDNGSTDPYQPETLLRFHARTQLLHEATAGSFAARNSALAVAVGEILAFTDTDCLPALDWLERGVAQLLAHPDKGFVGGRVEVFPQDEARLTAVERYEQLTAFPQERYIGEMNFSVTANMLTTRAVMDEVGLFNAQLKSGGDLEWGRRATAHGRGGVYAPDVVIRHPARRTFEQIRVRAQRIMGGYFEMKRERRSWAKTAVGTAWAFVPPLRETWAMVRQPHDMGAWNKVRALSVLYWRSYVMAVERVRLVLGGVTRRL